MVNLNFDDYSDIEVNISVPGDAHCLKAFEGLYRAWIVMGYLEEQFADMCEKYVENGDLIFY